MDDLRGRYLARIGIDAARDLPPNEPTLRLLQRAHLLAVPFENLDIHTGHTIVLDEAAILDKVVARRRGGFCYELNSAFAALLRALGFDVALLEARVHGRDGAIGIPFDHMALRVTVSGERFLADVGFGAFSDEPLRLDDRDEQIDTSGTFRIVDAANGCLDVLLDGRAAYRLSPDDHVLADFEPGCTHHQTSPDSHFTHGTVCSLRTAGGRRTLGGAELIETHAGEKTSITLQPDEIGPVLAGQFGVVLGPGDVAALRGS